MPHPPSEGSGTWDDWQPLLGGEVQVPGDRSGPPCPAWCRDDIALARVLVNGQAFETMEAGPPAGRVVLCQALPGCSLLQARFPATPETSRVAFCRTILALPGEYVALLDRLHGPDSRQTLVEWQLRARQPLRQTESGQWEGAEGAGLVIRLAEADSHRPPHPGAPPLPPRVCSAQRLLVGGEARYAAVLLDPLARRPSTAAGERDGVRASEPTIRPVETAPEPGDVVAGYEVERPGGRREVLMVGYDIKGPFRAAGYRCDGGVAVVRRRGAWLQAAFGADTRYLEHRGRPLVDGPQLTAFEVHWETTGVRAQVQMTDEGEVRLYAPGAKSARLDGETIYEWTEDRHAGIVVPPGWHEIALG